MSEQKWTCPRCDYVIVCLTRAGLNEFRWTHEVAHERALRLYFGYDTLRLSDFDLGFLKTRLVRI